MAATAFQPIDPETWKPVPHTPDTLIHFLRDTGSDTLDTSQETLSQEETEQLNDPFLDQSQQDDVNLHAASIDSEVSSSEEVQEQKGRKNTRRCCYKGTLLKNHQFPQGFCCWTRDLWKKRSTYWICCWRGKNHRGRRNTQRCCYRRSYWKNLISEESSVKDEQAPWDTMKRRSIIAFSIYARRNPC